MRLAKQEAKLKAEEAANVKAEEVAKQKAEDIENTFSRMVFWSNFSDLGTQKVAFRKEKFREI